MKETIFWFYEESSNIFWKVGLAVVVLFILPIELGEKAPLWILGFLYVWFMAWILLGSYLLIGNHRWPEFLEWKLRRRRR